MKSEEKEVLIYRDYYIKLYKHALNSNDEKLNHDVERYVNGFAERYLKIETKKSFPEYLNSTNYMSSVKPKFYRYPLQEETLKIKEGNKDGLDRLIKYFQILYDFRIKLYNNDITEDELQKLNTYIEKCVNSYFDKNVNLSLSNYVYSKVICIYCIINNLRFPNSQLNGSFELRNNNENKQYMYDKISDKLIRNCPEYEVLSKKDIAKLIKKLVKEKVDSYDEFKKTAINSYLSPCISRLKERLMDEEETLIEYNRNFSDKYDGIVEFIYNKNKFLAEKVLKKMNDNSIKSILEAQRLLEELIKEELDYSIQKKRCEKITHLERKLEEKIVKNKEVERNFDIEKARFGTLEERKREEEILYNELLYIRDKAMNDNYYTNDYDFIQNKIMDLYRRYIHAYVFGNSTKSATSYVSTRLGALTNQYKINLKKKFDRDEIELLYAKKSMRIIRGYLNTHELSDCEYKYFIEYIRSAFKYYICNLCSKEDIESFMLNTVLSYNYDDTKNICKVLKHHK